MFLIQINRARPRRSWRSPSTDTDHR